MRPAENSASEVSPALERVMTLPELPVRPEEAHKGTFGRVLVIAGSRGMSGAAALAGLGALRGGAGLVYVASPATVQPTIASLEASWLTIPLPDADGQLASDAAAALLSTVPSMSAVAIGPGLGSSEGVISVVEQLYSSVEQPLVVDADGLNALAALLQRTGALPPRAPSLPFPILTPHPGEFSRLCGRSIAEIQDEREAAAARFARQHSVILLLKGHRTVITDGRRVATNTTGNSGMATGGCGDVLTGLIAALLAQGMTPFEAAQFGAYLHGLAGDIAAEHLSRAGLIASDLPAYLPLAWKQVSPDA